MPSGKRRLAGLVVGVLVVTGLLLTTANVASARTNFHFGFHMGVPLAPYYGYAHPYPPPPAYYPPAPRYPAYPPCAKVWIPGYYDAYGNWVFGYYQYDCGYYGY